VRPLTVAARGEEAVAPAARPDLRGRRCEPDPVRRRGRCRLDGSSRVASAGKGLTECPEATELLWPTEPTTKRGAGELEVAESGSALAVDPGALGSGGRLLLVACPGPVERPRLEIREPLSTREKLGRSFAGCAVDLFTVTVEAP